jgi:hypothetical protein
VAGLAYDKRLAEAEARHGRLVPQTFFQTVTALPSATLGTDGPPAIITPPAGYRLLILHVGISTQAVSGETVTVTSKGTFEDGSTAGAGSNYSSTTGDVDAQNHLYALVGANNGNAGQLITGKVLASLAWTIKSTINVSGASVIARVWGLLIPANASRVVL